jgi:hypothetical protein
MSIPKEMAKPPVEPEAIARSGSFPGGNNQKLQGCEPS